MIDIEKIADSIRPKEKFVDEEIDLLMGTESPKKLPFSPDIYKARDIKGLVERMEFLLSMVDEWDLSSYLEQITKDAMINNGLTGDATILTTRLAKAINEWKRISFEGQVRGPLGTQLKESWNELYRVHDLLLIEQLAKAYIGIEGPNRRIHYSLDTQNKILSSSEHYTPEYYGKEEFTKIVEAVFKALDEEPENDKTELNDKHAPTTRAIALYYYYLSMCGGQSLTKTNAGQLASKFGKTSGNALYIRYLTILKDLRERTGITGNANGDKARLSNMIAAVELLKKDRHIAAHKLALKELKELEYAYSQKH